MNNIIYYLIIIVGLYIILGCIHTMFIWKNIYKKYSPKSLILTWMELFAFTAFRPIWKLTLNIDNYVAILKHKRMIYLIKNNKLNNKQKEKLQKGLEEFMKSHQ